MKKIYLFFITLSTLLGAFTNLHAQEPSELGNYRITKIGEAQNTFEANRWYLMGRNPYLVRNGGTDGYVYDSNTAPVDRNSLITNRECNNGCTDPYDGCPHDRTAPTAWSITSHTTGSFHINCHSGNIDGLLSVPYIEYWRGDNCLEDAEITHTRLTGLTSGYYRLKVHAHIYHQDHLSPRNSAPTGAVFFASGQSEVRVDLSSGTPTPDGYGYSGTYELIVFVDATGTLDFGFRVSSAMFNWLAFNNVEFSYFPNDPYEDKTEDKVANYLPDSGSAGTAGNKTVYKLVDSVTSGKKYLIVNSNSAGENKNVLTNINNSLSNTTATIIEGDPGNGTSCKYIENPNAGAVFTATTSTYTTFANNGYYLYHESGNLSLSTSTSRNNWTVGTNTLYYSGGGTTRYLQYSSSTWTLGTSSSNVYFYEETTITTTATSPSLDNYITTDYTLSLQNGNARYDLGDSWAGNAGDLYNDGNVFANATTVSHDQVTGLTNGLYQISIDARTAGTEPTPVVNPTVTPVEFKYNYTSTIGSIYETDNNSDVKITIETSDILTAIGAATTDDINVYAEDPDGTRWAAADNGDVLGTTDGWRNRKGYFSGWGEETTAYCIKLNYKAATNQVFYIGGHHNSGMTATPCVYTARFIYQNKTTLAEVPIIVTLTYGTSFHYEVTTPIGNVEGTNFYQGTTIDVDVADIRDAIGAADDNAYTVYADDGTSSVRYNATINGWRNAEGEFQEWGTNAYFYVQDESKSRYIVGGMPDHSNEVGSYTTRLLYKHNTTGATAAVYITLTYTAEFRYGAETQTGSVEFVNYHQATPVTVTDIETIRTALLASSLDDITVYSEEPNGTRVEGVRKDTNGWRDASGAFQAWGYANSYFYLQETDKQNYVMGGYPDHSTVPGSYTAKLIYRNNSNGKELPVYFTLTYYSDPTFYANGQKVKLSEGTKYEGSGYVGYRGTYTLDVVVSNGTLDFGFDVPQGYWKWLSFKNVELLYLGGQGLKVSENEKPSVGDNAGADDVKKYLVRFNYVSDGAQGTYWNIQMGTGNYAEEPIANAVTVRASSNPGRFFVYPAEGYRDGVWTVADGVFLKSTTSGATYNYYLQDMGVDALMQSFTNPNSATERWGVDINSGAVFTLYPLTLGEVDPDVPTLSIDYTGKFYKIKNRETGNYATYSTYTSSLYPELLMEKTGGYAMVTRAPENLNGASYWWFSDATSEAGEDQRFAAKGTKAVRIHNVMMHDMDYTKDPQGNSTPHTNETLYSTRLGVTSGGRLYYLLPAAEDGGTEYWAISRTEYSTDPDSWYTNDRTLDIIGQAGAMDEEKRYNMDNRSQWVLEEATLSEVWEAVKASKRRELHEGAYFSPTTETLDPIFSRYASTPTTQSGLLTNAENLGREIYAACTDPSLPTLAPEKGGRFYFRAYAADNHYFAEDNGLTLTNGRGPNTVWEIMPFSDPTPLVRVDDQPLYNDFSSAYYITLPHKSLQRFWLRNRSTGKFLTHEPADKSGLIKISDGVWNMRIDNLPGYDYWRGNSDKLGTKGNLEREDADLWYFDVVSNPRTGLRTGVLRTLFCYDYGPDNGVWEGSTWDGTLDSRGMPINQEYGDATAGYNLPVVQLDPSAVSVRGGGVTATDQYRSYSQWVIYDIDTDLPEAGVNYTLKNKYSDMYAYWQGTIDSGSLMQTEKVENLAEGADVEDTNRGVWMLQDLATPQENKYRIVNQWAGKRLTTGSSYSLSDNSGNNGSTYWVVESNIDSKGLAIGPTTRTPSDANFFDADSWMLSKEKAEDGVTKGASDASISIDDPKRNRPVWQLDKVDRLYDDITYDLNKMLGNLSGGTDIFYMKTSAVSGYSEKVELWRTYSENDYESAEYGNSSVNQATEYSEYKKTKDYVNGKIGDDNFVMPIEDNDDKRRYVIRNKETGRYLANMGKLMTVDSTEVSHYAIWDLALEKVGETDKEKKYFYTLTNEGANYVMDAEGGEAHNTDYKYMFFDENDHGNGFKMSNTSQRLHFRPDGEGYARLHYIAEGDKEMDDDLVLYGPTHGDRLVVDSVLRNNNVYWEVIPVNKFFTNARTLDKFKTEVGLVKAEALAMGGYSGGPLTLEESDMSGIAGNLLTALRTDIVGTSSVDSEGGAKTWGTLMNRIWNIDSTLPGDEPLYLLKWKPGFEVYLETVFRPTAKQRLTTGSGSEAWTTSTTQDDSDNRQTFEFEETATSSGKYYLKNRNTSRYLGKSTTDDGDVTSVSDNTDAAQLEVKEIVPGIYSMEDGSNRFLSISEDGNVVWAPACGYGALWRIHCFNYIQRTGSKITGTSDLWQGKYVRTFRSPTDTRVKVSDGMKVYYGKNETGAASGKTTRERTDGTTERQVSLTFNEVTADGDGLLNMEGGESYILVKDEQLAKDDIKVWSKYMGSESILGQNLLSSQVESFTITSDNQKNVFALNYIAPGTPIGSIGGQQVTAFGVGFYPLRVGAAVPAYTPFLSSTTISTAISELREAINGDKASSVKGEVDVPSIQIVFKNNDGTSDRIEVPIATDNTEDMGPVYDLSGRKVADRLSNVSKRGMYIVNGQKVLRK